MSRVRIPESSASVSVLLFAAIVLVLLFARVVLIPLAFALTLSFLLGPAVNWLETRGIRRKLAVALVSIGTFAGLVVGGYVLSRQILSVAQTLPAYRVNIHRKLESVHSSSAQSLEAAAGVIEDISRDLLPGQSPPPTGAVRVQVVNPRSDQLQATAGIIGSVLEPLGQLGIVILFTIYMLMNSEDLRHRMLVLAGMGHINVMTQALEDATARISRYLVMQFQVNAAYGILFALALYSLHVPQATLWGAIAGALRIVPYVGVMIGVALPLMLSFAVSSSWWTPVLILVFFLALEITTANVVEPLLFSSRTGISSLALLGSAIFWSMLWGWPGLALATPLTVCAVVLGSHVPQLSFLQTLLGTNAQLSPPARMYERLLAMDQDAAWTVAEEFLAGKPLAELYDAVLLPVLSHAEEDRQKGVLSDRGWDFVLLCIGELVARLSEYEPNSADAPERTAVEKEIAVVCFYAGGQADELATIMLTQLLERAGFRCLLLGPNAVNQPILRGLSAEKDTAVIISALPPFAFAQSRKLCQQVREHMSGNRIAVALWNSEEDADELLARFGALRPEAVFSSLAESVRQVREWQRATRLV